MSSCLWYSLTLVFLSSFAWLRALNRKKVASESRSTAGWSPEGPSSNRRPLPYLAIAFFSRSNNDWRRFRGSRNFRKRPKAGRRFPSISREARNWRRRVQTDSTSTTGSAQPWGGSEGVTSSIDLGDSDLESETETSDRSVSIRFLKAFRSRHRKFSRD